MQWQHLKNPGGTNTWKKKPLVVRNQNFKLLLEEIHLRSLNCSYFDESVTVKILNSQALMLCLTLFAALCVGSGEWLMWM